MKSDQPVSEHLKVFAIQNFMLEADLAKLENSGIEIGHLQTMRKDEVVDTELFDHDIRTQARKMADFYVLYYCLENSIRRLISERLKEKYEANWWDEKVPDGVKASVKEKQQKEKDSVFSIRSEDPLTYT